MYKAPTSVSVPSSLVYKRKAQDGRGITRHKKRKRHLKLKKNKKIKNRKKKESEEGTENSYIYNNTFIKKCIKTS